MLKLKFFELTSIAAAMSSISASLTLEQAGILVGIVTALVTCALNVFCTIRRDLREERMLQIQLKARHDKH